MRESALEIKNRFEGPEMREEEQSGIMFRCLCWVMPLADVRKKRADLGWRMISSVLDMPHLRFFQRVIDKWPISPVAQERGGCLSSASKTLIGSS